MTVSPNTFASRSRALNRCAQSSRQQQKIPFTRRYARVESLASSRNTASISTPVHDESNSSSRSTRSQFLITRMTRTRRNRIVLESHKVSWRLFFFFFMRHAINSTSGSNPEVFREISRQDDFFNGLLVQASHVICKGLGKPARRDPPPTARQESAATWTARPRARRENRRGDRGVSLPRLWAAPACG